LLPFLVLSKWLNSMTEKSLSAALTAPVPLDSDGYAPSFLIADRQAIQDFLQEYGFVILRDVLSPEARRATLDEFWQQGARKGLRPDDPESWDSFWKRQRFAHFGIIGSFPDLSSITQLTNRCSPTVHAAFSAVLQDSRLWVDHDRLGVLAPTTHDGSNHTDWRTIENWLHVDCNPISGPDGRTGYAAIAGFNDNGSAIDFHKTLIIQGLLTLTDARVEDGGFHCVPGSHRICHGWAQQVQHLPSTVRQSMQVPPEDPLREHIQKIPIRAGCLLAWSSLLMHGNHPNNSDRMRAVQYIRMMSKNTPYSPLAPERADYPEDFAVTPLAAKLLGFEPWKW
jgi:hypothetical protein